MSKYKYTITDKFGKEKKGVMDAVSIDAATTKLKGDGSIVLSIQESHSLSDSSWNITIGNPVKKKDIVISTGKGNRSCSQSSLVESNEAFNP